jgi:hypothetical protein
MVLGTCTLINSGGVMKSLKIPKGWSASVNRGRTEEDQTKKNKRINNDLQTITHKTNDPVIQIPLQTGGELMFSGRVGRDYQSLYYFTRHSVW